MVEKNIVNRRCINAKHKDGICFWAQALAFHLVFQPDYNYLTGYMINYLEAVGCTQFYREELKYSEDAIDAFGQAFYYSCKNSIDAFLEHRIEFMDIGKAAIAASLIGFEVPEYIFKYKQDNWLRYTFDRLSTRFEEFGRNRLSIITFNYDRAAEWFLFTSLLNSYGKTYDECVEMLKSIPVIHLHGRLGYLPWEKPPGRAFGNIVDENTPSREYRLY